MTALAMRTVRAHQRRQRAARRGHAQRCGGRSGPTRRPTSCPSASSPTACTCRPGCPRGPSIRWFDHYLGAGWLDRTDDAAVVGPPVGDSRRRAVGPAREAAARPVRVAFASAIRSRWTDERVSPNRVVAAGALLDPQALTIGYARRFTAYKRPELIFRDPDRLARDPERRRIARCRSSSPARPTPPTSRPSITCSACSSAASTRPSAAASPSSTTTTCTSRTTWCTAATCGSTTRASRSRRAGPAA